MSLRIVIRAVVGLSLAGLAGVATPATGQDTPAKAGVSNRGWIGVSFQLTGEGTAPPDAIVITDVRQGSPAAAAGLRPGDRVVAINELRTPRELAALPERLRIRAGDVVTMVIDREGERRRIRLEAAPRPEGFTSGRTVHVSVQADSLVDTWARSMDSLRVRLRSGGDTDDVWVRRLRGRAAGGPVQVRVRRSDRGVQPPFEFFVFRGEAHDSLRLEMLELNRLTERLQRRIAEREIELRRGLAGVPGDRTPGDPELRRLRRELEEASSRSVRLEAAMAEAARATAGLAYDAEPRSGVAAGDPVVASEFRPLTPYLMGRNRVAGAEVVDLEPELARYFDVTRGVLVVDVAPRTPAAMAGIIPGDVITHVDQVGVRTVEELRFGVSVADETLPLTLVREGTSRQVLLRR